jgi:hypothetical protein
MRFINPPNTGSSVLRCIGPVHALPQQRAVVLHVHGHMKQLSLFPVISVLCHWALACSGFGGSENVLDFLQLPLCCYHYIRHYQMDISEFSGRGPLIHFTTQFHDWLSLRIRTNRQLTQKRQRISSGNIFNRNRHQCCHLSKYTQVCICCLHVLKRSKFGNGWE